jgi:DNA modification methylase
MDRKQTTVLEFDRPTTSKEHPTMKPVDLIMYSLEHSKQGVVLDPFAGSGSTLIAAHRLGLSSRLVELDPKYCDVICDRFRAETGLEPVLEKGR